jgi:hypothetical protein
MTAQIHGVRWIGFAAPFSKSSHRDHHPDNGMGESSNCLKTAADCPHLTDDGTRHTGNRVSGWCAYFDSLDIILFVVGNGVYSIEYYRDDRSGDLKVLQISF